MEYYKLPLNCPQCKQEGEVIEIHYSADGSIYIFGICVMCGKNDIVWMYSAEELVGAAAIQDKENDLGDTLEEFLGKDIGKTIKAWRCKCSNTK